MPEPARLDLEHYVPHFLSTIANRWMSTSSRIYLQRFGIGVVEWKILGHLGSIGPERNATSLEIARASSIDPAAASRGMQALVRKGLVEPLKGRFTGNAKPFAMTEQGVALFRDVHEVALEREAMLLHGLGSDERTQLLDLLKKLDANLDRL
ncbi:winged helix-turn-helix transcriptional regulator [Novosphingobium flavum]|uniref:Winged helix-turn-helix transcriptional regulator n=1 Tax=Novosphingobium flavum TaxID=1778672 RepID=A0A7X1FUB8_9SPHN|nr:MarR family winged helix-turn-helix transcriptional regulator [Novosphingobium flavum]MBC2666984.1 winged helix-turn-helix transcriptional regulator [Novosphingobium flavum]